MSANNGGSPDTHLARQLRKERTARGWSVHELSRRSGIGAGHISNLENGVRGFTERLCERLDEVFPERKHWFSEYYRDSQEWTPPGYRHWAEYEDRAVMVRTWVGGVIHGLAQTPEYARAHLLTLSGASVEVVSRRLQARLERQQRLYDRHIPVWHLVDELSLYRDMGGAEVMAAQMTHLLDLPKNPDVRVVVVPGAGHAAVHAGVTVTDNAAYTEHLAGGGVYTDDEIGTELRRLVDTLQADSYRTNESADIIRSARDIWTCGESPLTALRKAATALRLGSQKD